MKKLLIILFYLPLIGFGQTLIPDANFEQALINLGYDTGIPNGSVPTANINTVTSLNVGYGGPGGSSNITDLTGIEDFIALTSLGCSFNQLTSLDVSANTALISLNCQNNSITSLDLSNNTDLYELWIGSLELTSLDISNNTDLSILGCFANQLTSLDVSNNTALTEFHCDSNQLTSLDVSNNTALTWLYCSSNELTTLNVSQNTALTGLNCEDNQLTSLDLSNNIALTRIHCNSNDLTILNLKNGNNLNLFGAIIPNPLIPGTNQFGFRADDNPNLGCVIVDDSTYSENNWSELTGFYFDNQTYFSNNCSGATSIQEHTKNKELLKVTDLLGRVTKGTKNEVLFYIYDDGTVEKRIIIE